MKVDIQFGDNSGEISFTGYDVAFVGDYVDERGQKAVDYLRSSVGSVSSLNYVPNALEIQLNGTSIDVDSFADVVTIKQADKVIIDATTIGFVELLLLSQLLVDIKTNFSVLYVEPNSYSKRQQNELLRQREFDLSVQTLGYTAIPGHALAIDNNCTQKVVFLCGYEAERMDRVIEDSEIISRNCKCIFGLPAFKPGWEMDSFANNISIMKGKDMRRDIDFCGATNPMSVYNKLHKTFDSLGDEDQMFVVPLATKPMSIGACLFLALKPKDQVAVLYDHPKKKSGRGEGVGKWHLYNVVM